MKENKNKKIVIITIFGIIFLFIILIAFIFIGKKIQLNNYISNHDFIGAGNMEKTFYDNHSQDIVDMIDTNIGNSEIKKGLEIYEKLFDYILSSKEIDYDSNSELWYRYKQVEEYLPQNEEDYMILDSVFDELYDIFENNDLNRCNKLEPIIIFDFASAGCDDVGLHAYNFSAGPENNKFDLEFFGMW